MTQYMSEYLLKKLRNKYILEEDIEVYRFGLELLIATFFKAIGLLIIGLAFGIMTEIIVLILFFSGLRIQAGGYHAKTPITCFLGTLGMIFTSTFLIRIIAIEYKIYFIFISVIISILMVIYYAPVENENRPLSEKEKVIYKRRSIVTVTLSSILVLIFTFLNNELIYLGQMAITGLLFESFTLINIKKKKKQGKA